jgi:predicted alpha/beta hydrolase
MQLLVDRGTDRLSVRFYDNAQAETVFVVFPAMGVPGGYYGRLAVSMVEAGYAVAVADLRGTGDSTPTPSRRSSYGYTELVDDIGAVLEALAPQRKGRKTILLGHSLGGQACVMYLASAQHNVDGLVLIAVGMPYWRIYGRRRLGVFVYTQGIAALTALLRVWPGWSFGGKQARGVIRDWGYTGRHGVFPPHVGAEEKLGDIKVAVLAISVEHDQYTPPNTMDHVVTKMTGAQVTRKHLTTEQAGIPLDHFKWVKAGPALVKEFRQWLP